MTRLTSLAIVTCTAAFVSGMALALLGSLKPRLAAQLPGGAARVDRLLTALHVALIPMMLLTGVLLDVLGVRQVMIVGSLLLSLAIFGLSLRDSTLSALIAVLALAVGIACVSTASVVLMPKAFGFGPRGAAASVNLGFVFLALGALMTPTLIDLLLRSLDLRRGLGLIALVGLVPGIAAGVGGTIHMGEHHADLEFVLTDVRLWMLGIAFLLYAPIEFAVSTWGTTYLSAEQGYGERTSARILTAFWLMFVASRVLTTWVLRIGWLREGAMPTLILLLALLAAIALANLAGGARPRSAVWALVGLGFFLGPIFPTLVALGLRQFPESSGTAYGAMFAFGSVGSLVLMPVLEMFVSRGAVARGLRLLAPVALLLVVVALAIALK